MIFQVLLGLRLLCSGFAQGSRKGADLETHIICAQTIRKRCSSELKSHKNNLRGGITSMISTRTQALLSSIRISVGKHFKMIARITSKFFGSDRLNAALVPATMCLF